MALIMKIVAMGVDWPESYWKVAKVEYFPMQKAGRVAFCAFPNKETAALFGTKEGEERGVKPFDKAYGLEFTDYHFDKYFAGRDWIAGAYEMAKDMKLIGDAPADGEEDKRTCFFEGAIDA